MVWQLPVPPSEGAARPSQAWPGSGGGLCAPCECAVHTPGTLGDLKQHTCASSRFWKLEVWMSPQNWVPFAGWGGGPLRAFSALKVVQVSGGFLRHYRHKGASSLFSDLPPK